MIKKISINKIIIVALFFVWFFSFLYFSEYGFFSINEKYKDNLNLSSTKLYKDNKISGEIKANHDGLAIIKLKFADVKRVDLDKQDNLEFRLKNKDGKNWLVTNKYQSGIINGNLDFPIGFSPLVNSKDKKIYFEILSRNGNENNLVILSQKNIIEAIYFYNRSEVLSSIINLSEFLILKIYSSFRNFDQLISSLIYAIPLLAFILYLFLKRKNILNTPLYLIASVLIIADIFLINAKIYGISFATFALLIGINIKFKNLLTNIILFSSLLIMWLILIQFELTQYTSKLNLWLYLSLILILFSVYLFEFRNKSKTKNFTYKNIYEDATQLFRFKLYEFLNLSKLFNQKNILDLGCGYGPDAINFAEYAKTVVGLDIDRHKDWKYIKNKKIKFLVGDSSNIPFEKNKFDAVFLKDLLHHVGEVDKSLHEIERVTKPNGKIVIIEGNRYNPLFYFYVTKLKGHEHFTKKQFEKLIENNFKEYKIYSYNIYPPFFLKVKVYRVCLNLILKTNMLVFLKQYFSYNIAVITKI